MKFFTFRLALMLGFAGAVLAEPLPFDEVALPYFEEHCFDCHNSRKQEGDFRIDTLSRDFLEGEDAELWLEILDRINTGEMPPEEEPRPDHGWSEEVVTWLGDRVKEGVRYRMAQRAPVEHYRLSREEYANSVYDLLGVDYDPAAPGEMSEDPEWHGFTRIGSELSLAPSHIEKYLKAARSILDVAYPDRVVETRTYVKDALDIDWPNRQKRAILEEQGVADQVRTPIWPGERLTYVGPGGSGTVPPGTYRAKLTLSGLQPPKGRPPHVTIYSKEMDRMIFEQDVVAPENAPVTIEFETFLSGPSRMEIKNDVPGPSNSGRSGRRTGQFVFTTLDNPLSRAPWQRKLIDDEGNAIYPFLIFDKIEWEGPLESPETNAKRARFFPSEDAPDLDEARGLLTGFATKAWRRPPSVTEMERYIALIEGELAAGEKFRDAYKVGMLAVMASKNFYYLTEGDPEHSRDTLSEYELASRLAYFLWSSAPDAELLALAEEGELSDPETLKAQVARLIADPKIDRFTEDFPRQWLQLGKVGTFPPDEKLYPDYDQWLEKSMIHETTGFFAEVFANNLSIREFLHSEWTVVNPRLAWHYGLPTPPSSGFQRVALRPEDHRGGILTHGSTLSLTSDGTRHRPVHRGVWVSEAIFGKVPNPPPPNVDPIEPNPVDKPKATVREKLAAHTENPACASCHRAIDPYGLAFDNYDAVGKWRTVEVVSDGKGEDPLVDASGEMPDGRKYSGPEAFKTILTENLDDFGYAFTEKLATYALRRPMSVLDDEAIEQIARANAEKGFPARDLIETLVLSDLFLQR